MLHGADTLLQVSVTGAEKEFKVTFKTKESILKEGPLALLWELIRSYEVDIFEVPLSRITTDFCSYMVAQELLQVVKTCLISGFLHITVVMIAGGLRYSTLLV